MEEIKKTNKKKQVAPVIINSQPLNGHEQVAVGDLVLTSQVLNTIDLADLALKMLKHEEIKNYLGFFKVKKKTGEYLG